MTLAKLAKKALGFSNLLWGFVTLNLKSLPFNLHVLAFFLCFLLRVSSQQQGVSAFNKHATVSSHLVVL